MSENHEPSHHYHPSRRTVLATLGLVPAAFAAGSAWAVENAVTISEEGGMRVIRSNGIPDHATGQFPNRHNPNRIAAQNYTFRIDAHPRKTGRFTPLEHGNFGVAMNGIPFDPFTAEFWRRNRQSGWRYEAMTGKVDLGLDSNNAHVQPNGAYHYHGLPVDLVKRWSTDHHSGLIGYAADGFPIYALYGFSGGRVGDEIRPMRSGWRLKQGSRPSGGPGGSYDGTFVEDFEFVDGAGDLDAANGRETQTPEFPNGIYAYFLTDSYPFIPRYFAGRPDDTFRHGPPGGGMGGGMPGGMPGGPPNGPPNGPMGGGRPGMPPPPGMPPLPRG
ncbi:YHYH protein [Rhodospirillaceae bacterium KN72]|uniref:YHYH protein n=1 Tax=Pacificispira spongiicola TaxID=2729598 RepID=A0A7Y0HFS3_9PROT|nr:YHYH protein [Pacificispira spongiicola]NMM44197.1 YHYH protein [Pacificispira spongiicola]